MPRALLVDSIHVESNNDGEFYNLLLRLSVGEHFNPQCQRLSKEGTVFEGALAPYVPSVALAVHGRARGEGPSAVTLDGVRGLVP